MTAQDGRDRGAVATEYALLAFAVAAVIVVVVVSLGSVVHDMFASHSACFSSHLESRSC
ncbi:MAG TPA: hypothetical protein VE781_05885 [Kineosporiaceae bacterium]|nr:hypothetical protein [Kineosporiaceae bacterium]